MPRFRLPVLTITAAASALAFAAGAPSPAQAMPNCGSMARTRAIYDENGERAYWHGNYDLANFYWECSNQMSDQMNEMGC